MTDFEEYERIRLKRKAGEELTPEEWAAFSETKEEKKLGVFPAFIWLAIYYSVVFCASAPNWQSALIVLLVIGVPLLIFNRKKYGTLRTWTEHLAEDHPWTKQVPRSVWLLFLLIIVPLAITGCASVLRYWPATDPGDSGY